MLNFQTLLKSKRFNGWGWFDRQKGNLMSYCKEIVKSGE